MLGWVRSAAGAIRRRPRLASWVLRTMPDLPWTLELPNLGAFRIRLRRNRSLWLRDPEEFERASLRALQRLVRPGDVVADVGANLGLYSRFLAKWTDAGRVLAFEPWEENCEVFSRNLTLGGVGERVELLRTALGDVDGEVVFQVDDMQSASGALDRVRSGAASEGRELARLPPRTVVVPCRALDSLVRAGTIPAPDVLKIDVEGAEALVLRGARSTLESRHPRLLVELHGEEVAREVIHLLLEAGYRVVGWGAGDWREIAPRELRETDLAEIHGRYGIHFLAASVDGGLPTREELRVSPFARSASGSAPESTFDRLHPA